MGPVYFAGARALATYTPAQYGWATFGRHGRFYKFGLVVRPGVVVTVTIGPSARGHAVIEMNVDGVNRGMTSVTYRSCPTAGGFYAQGIAFTHPPFRGCVPVAVTVAGQPGTRHATLPLFARHCT